MKNFAIIVGLALCVSLFVGCQSKNRVSVEQKLSSPLDSTAAATLIVEPAEGVKRSKAIDKAVRSLRGDLYNKLVAEGIVGSIVPKASDARYRIDVKLLADHEVSTTARVLFGVMAGRNEIVVNVRVTDLADGRQLTMFNCKGKSASHPMSSENAMSDALDEAVDGVIATLDK